jgi:hypothetical protein
MNRRLKSRIEQLEKITNPRRTVCIWEDGTGSADREIAKRKAAGDMDDVEFMIVSWVMEPTLAEGGEVLGRRTSAAKSGE